MSKRTLLRVVWIKSRIILYYIQPSKKKNKKKRVEPFFNKNERVVNAPSNFKHKETTSQILYIIRVVGYNHQFVTVSRNRLCRVWTVWNPYKKPTDIVNSVCIPIKTIRVADFATYFSSPFSNYLIAYHINY